LSFSVVSGTCYTFSFDVLFQSAAITNGLKLGLTFPAATVIGANVYIPIAADGTAAAYHGYINTSGDSVVGTAVATADTTYLASLWGTIRPSANGTLQVQHASEISTARGVRIMADSMGALAIVA
jgi:hypothetical protein